MRLTADGVPVISHDADVSRRTDGSGFVHELTLAEIKRLDAGGGAEVPTLLDALDLLTGRAGIDIEIKNIPGDPDFDSPREALAEEVVKIVDELEIAESMLQVGQQTQRGIPAMRDHEHVAVIRHPCYPARFG